jgi:hypothetical protein
MFKVKSYYVINSIHSNKEYYGSNFWNSGYSYKYIPTSYAIKYIRETADLFNENKKPMKCINWCVVKSEDEQELYIKITGNRKLVEEFVSKLFERDPQFTSYFTMKPVPSYYLP